MHMTNPDLPAQPVVEVDEYAFRTVWQYRGWEEVKPAPPVEDLNVDDVLAKVGGDPALAAAALAAEQERDKPRKSLVTKLAGIADTTNDSTKGS
jgi:hypothetical protein